MFSTWFSAKPLLETDSREWLEAAFAWCLAEFDRDYFYQSSQLVQPSNQFFPGRADSPQGMAKLIFEQVCTYAGMAHWPFQLQPPSCALSMPEQIELSGKLRGDNLPAVAADSPRLPVQYEPQQVTNPEAMIASYAHSLAYYLSQTASQKPPGDIEYWPYATEVLAIFMGFGLMFANSAFVHPGGCGSCRPVGRAAYLSEREATYALAMFCAHKQIAAKQVTPHLKRHLRGFFKQALQEQSFHKSA